MSGVSSAWILVMISWLMFSTCCHLIVMLEFCAFSFATSALSRPAWTGASMLDQMVTVLLSPPPLPPPPQAVRLRAATVTNAVPSSVVRRMTGLLMSAPWGSSSLRLGSADPVPHVIDTTC